MFIKEIELNNFRIYKGKNKIELLPENNKNVIVISGKNGFGKTTFLMSLVWCLYGRQMEKVDELYQKEIADKGGYGKYIGNSLNRLAKSNGETKFSVSVTFTDVNIQEITACKEVKITRIFDIMASSNDKVEVLIDGYQNELIRHDLATEGKQDGEEIFIRNFILPIEIAKFFFFDAEKITSLAEMNSPEQRKILSKAYTEVLGIKVHEDLKNTEESLLDEYRKKSAKPEEHAKFNQIQTDLKNKDIEIEKLENEIEELNQEEIEKQSDSNEIQIKLIQEGSVITLEDLNNLKDEKKLLESKINELQKELKDLFELIPFGLAGEILMEVSNQLENEHNYKKDKLKQEDVEENTNRILNDIEEEKKKFNGVIETKIRDFYESQIKILIKKHFFSDIPDLPVPFSAIHDFSNTETNEFYNLINNLKHSFREKFTRLNNDYSRSKNELQTINRKIINAEKNAEDKYISNLRADKEHLDRRIYDIKKHIQNSREQIGILRAEIKSLRQNQESLRKKIDDSIAYSKKNEVINDTVSILKNFIKNLKIYRKKKLEENILNGLRTLMHKRGLIKNVTVDINSAGDDVDINLFDDRDQKIDKNSLSIREFYPNVSDQVILFPLLHKELTENEFELLKPNISKSYIIHNVNVDMSKFIETETKDLIKTYNNLYANKPTDIRR